MLSFVILRALGLDTWLGGLLNYMSCLVGESTKCFGNGTDERNAKSTDGYQSFRFLVWENGWELDGMGFMKDYQLFWIVNQNHGSVNNESLQILWNIPIFIRVPLPWLLEKVSWICPGLIGRNIPFLFKFRVMEMKNNLRRFCRKEKRLIQVKVFKHMLLHILPPECQIYCKTKKKKMRLFKLTDAITLLRVSTFWPQLSVECFGFSLFGKKSPAASGRGSDRLHFFLEAYKMRLAPIGSSVASQLKEMWDQEIITRKPLDGYIYLHLPSTSTIHCHVGRYTGPMDPMGNPFGSFKYFDPIWPIFFRWVEATN